METNCYLKFAFKKPTLANMMSSYSVLFFPSKTSGGVKDVLETY